MANKPEKILKEHDKLASYDTDEADIYADGWNDCYDEWNKYYKKLERAESDIIKELKNKLQYETDRADCLDTEYDMSVRKAESEIIDKVIEVMDSYNEGIIYGDTDIVWKELKDEITKLKNGG